MSWFATQCRRAYIIEQIAGCRDQVRCMVARVISGPAHVAGAHVISRASDFAHVITAARQNRCGCEYC